jgi:hypothetical protein
MGLGQYSAGNLEPIICEGLPTLKHDMKIDII